MQTTTGQIAEIATLHCSDYPNIELCGPKEQLSAIDASLKGVNDANKDLHRVIKKLRDKLGMSIDEYLIFLEEDQ
tara:strand:- start:171 stop:395 length:225 start_codon:yes stop_codon:yes gene_type:complete